MASHRLSALAVKRAKMVGLYGDGHGLCLRVGGGDARSWVLRYMIAGRAREMGLGSEADYTLAEARERARQYRKLVKDGVDPIEARRKERADRQAAAAKSMTFRQCAEAYIATNRAVWKNPKHAAQWPSTLEMYVYPLFGSLPIQSVDVGLVMKAIKPIWIAKAETASRVRGRIETILDCAKASGYRQGENPARWRGHLAKLLPKAAKAKRAARAQNGRGEHHAALPYAEIADFMAALRAKDGIAARALEFAILTAARTGEVVGATWAEVDLEARLWTIPGVRMKADREHRVPISGAAMAILEALPRKGHRVFGGLSNMAMLMLLRRMNRRDITVHGFRSTFADWCAEQTNFASEVRDMALAHTVGDETEAAYRRGDLFDKRRRLAEAWAGFCTAPAGGKVVPLRRAGAK